MNETQLSHLSPDVVRHLALTSMTGLEIIRLCQTSSYFKRALCDQPLLWRDLYHRDFTVRIPNLPYREAYIEATQAVRGIEGQRNGRMVGMAAARGYEKLIENLILKGYRNLNQILIGASFGGRLDILERVISVARNLRKPLNYHLGLIGASRGGQLEVMKMMIQLGANRLDESLIEATKYGQLGSVRFLVKMGARRLSHAIPQAVKLPNREIIEYLVSRGARIQQVANFSAESGRRDLVTWAIGLGALDFDRIMMYATRGGHRDIVKDMLERGATDINGALSVATEANHPEMIQMMIDLGAQDTNRAMITAVRAGHTEIVDWMLRLGANNSGEGLVYASAYGQLELVTNFLQMKITQDDLNWALTATRERLAELNRLFPHQIQPWIDIIRLLSDRGAIGQNPDGLMEQGYYI